EHTSELQSLTNLVCRLLLEKKTCALRSEEHTSELQSLTNLVCGLLLEKNTLPDGMRDQTERSKLAIQEQTKSACTTWAASVLLSMSSEPDRDATDWGFFFLMNRPPPEFAIFPQTSAFPN